MFVRYNHFFAVFSHCNSFVTTAKEFQYSLYLIDQPPSPSPSRRYENNQEKILMCQKHSRVGFSEDITRLLYNYALFYEIQQIKSMPLKINSIMYRLQSVVLNQ